MAILPDEAWRKYGKQEIAMKKNGKIKLAIFSSGFALVILAKFSSDFLAKKPCTGETFSQCSQSCLYKPHKNI